MEQSTKLHIHYNLSNGKHYIPVEQSIATEQAIQRVVKNLSDSLYEGDIKFSVYIEAEDEGWVVKNFFIGAAIIGSYALSAWADGILKWLTWNNISEHAENVTVLLKESTIAFLSEPSMNLVEKGLCKEEFYDAYEAKNLLYKLATANHDVLGIWFCKENDFPVDRDMFPYKTIELKREKESSDFIDKYHHLLVVSPINLESEKHLKWKVKDFYTMESFSVSMWDEDFYEVYFSNSLMVKEFKVRVRYYISTDSYWEQKIDDKKIIMVYEYNKTKNLMKLPKNIVFEPAPYILPENYTEVSGQSSLFVN